MRLAVQIVFAATWGVAIWAITVALQTTCSPNAPEITFRQSAALSWPWAIATGAGSVTCAFLGRRSMTPTSLIGACLAFGLATALGSYVPYYDCFTQPSVMLIYVTRVSSTYLSLLGGALLLLPLTRKMNLVAKCVTCWVVPAMLMFVQLALSPTPAPASSLKAPPMIFYIYGSLFWLCIVPPMIKSESEAE